MSIIAKYNLNWNVNDSSGNWYNGTSTSVSYASWFQNQAWVFNGTSSKIDLPTFTITNGSMWIIFNQTTLWANRQLLTIANSADNQVFDLRVSSANKIYIWTYNGSTSNTYSTATSVVANKYNYLEVTKSWATFIIYMNWIQIWSTSLHNITIWWDRNAIWYKRVANLYYFLWKLDEVIMRNNVLSPWEVNTNNLYYKWFM